MPVPKSLAGYLESLGSGAYERLAKWFPVKKDPQSYAEEHKWLTAILADARTEVVFALLANEFRRTPILWAAFFHAMWTAREGLDPRSGFDRRREQLVEAGTISGQIAEVARELASLLRQLRATGVALPHELNGLRGLLASIRLQEGEHIDYLLGRDEPDDDEWSGHTLARTNIAMAWHFAPRIDAAIDALSLAAGAYEPYFDDAVGASITRQTHLKNEFIRAAANQFIRYLVPLSKVVASATAEMMNIISDDPDNPVTGQEVQAQFKRVKKTQSDI